uniref:Uncharacterized protein n=1 Tax=Avena sativa TaxID=4498 RepID=A0ACD5X8P4_AVESA
MRCLRINYDNIQMEEPYDINKFINCLLLLREPSCTLADVELHCTLHDGGEYVDFWIRHALLCQAQMLCIYIICSEDCYVFDGPPLVSRHLRRLKLRNVEFVVNFLDFSSCSQLEDLRIENCCIGSSRILSQSVKHLVIDDCLFEDDEKTQLISVPNLISLQFIECRGRTPLFESMMSLETAVVRLNGYNDSWFWLSEECEEDICVKGHAGECCGTCAVCCGYGDHGDRCVLLEGLSSATSLELVAASRLLIFRRDLRWCPTFSKLKTLLLSEWCVQVDLRGLVCMLEHSPVLENLTLTFRKQGKTTRTLEVEGNSSLMEKPAAISGYLKIIKVECEEIDVRVCKVLKFLSILDMEIIIKRTSR